MTNEIRFTFFEESVHPFLVIFAVIHRAAHPLNTFKFIGVHGVCLAQYTQLFFDNGNG